MIGHWTVTPKRPIQCQALFIISAIGLKQKYYSLKKYLTNSIKLFNYYEYLFVKIRNHSHDETYTLDDPIFY